MSFIVEVLSGKRHCAIDKIAQCVSQFVINQRLESFPSKIRIFRLWHHARQTVPKIIWRMPIQELIQPNRTATRCGKLQPLDIQKLIRRFLIGQHVVTLKLQHRRKNNGVKDIIVLGIEVIELRVLVLPVTLPSVGVTLYFSPFSCCGNIADWCIKPYVEDLVSEAVLVDRRTPLEVSGNAAAVQALLQKILCEFRRVFRPIAHFRCTGLIDPSLELWSDLGQVDEDVLARLRFWRGATDRAPRLDKLDRINQFAAVVALITAGIVILAEWASALDVSIGKEPIAIKALELL